MSPVSELYRVRELLKIRLRQLEKQNTGISASTAHTTATQHPSDIKSIPRSRATNRDLVTLVETIESGTPLEPSQVESLTRLLLREIELLSEGLKGQCSLTANHYPRNLTVGNFCDFITLPTLVYELEYPRTEKIDWAYAMEKIAATFGIIIVMIAVSQSWIYPAVMETVQMKEAGLTAQQRLQEFPWVLSDLLFPFMIEYLLAFYVIWECVVRDTPPYADAALTD